MSPKPAWKYGLRFFWVREYGFVLGKKTYDALVTKYTREHGGGLCGILSRYGDGRWWWWWHMWWTRNKTRYPASESG